MIASSNASGVGRPARRLLRRRMATAVFVASTGLLASCSDGQTVADDVIADVEPTSAAPDLPELDDALFIDSTGADDLDVAVIDNSYEDRYVTVDAGTTITWTNLGRVEHNVTPSIDGQFEGVGTDDFGPGATFSITITEPGEYQYYCTIHGTPRNGQTGAIRVVG